MRRTSLGFSLIEMAIVLVIITTVLTLGLGTLTTVFSSANYAETRKRQDRIKDALIAYLGANKRLPCPALGNPDGNLATNDVTGAEARDPVTLVCAAPFGIVPYATLGLGREVAEDGWQNFFSYQVMGSSSNCANNPPTTYTTDINWTNASCFGAGKTGGLWVYDGGLKSDDTLLPLAVYNNSTTPTDSRAVVVLVSHGPNGLGAWTRQGTQNSFPPGALCEEKLNADRAALASGCNLPVPSPAPPPTIDVPSITNTFIAGGREGNDDVVAYLTRDDLIQPLAKQGAMLSAPAQQMTEDKYKIISEITVSSDCVPTVTSPSSVLDPWGKPYTVTVAGTSFPVTISGGTPTTSVSITLAEYKKLTGNDCTPPPPP